MTFGDVNCIVKNCSENQILCQTTSAYNEYYIDNGGYNPGKYI